MDSERQILSQLRKVGDGSWIGKSYRTGLFQDGVSKSIPLIINYVDQFSFGRAVGIASDKYKIEKKHDTYVFVVDGRTYALRYRQQVKVVDFDLVDYNPVTKDVLFTPSMEFLSEEQGKQFEKKICRLLPVTNEENWKERQRALLQYIKTGWTILDEEGQRVQFATFADEDKITLVLTAQSELNPEVEWVKMATVRAVKTKVKEENFKMELKALLAKYDML